MKRTVICGIVLALMGAAVFGDSIDDAEAKRRGVPVAQVLAEHAAAAEKARVAATTREVGAVTTTRPVAATPAAPGAAYTFSLNRTTVVGAYDTHVNIERTYVTTLNAPSRPPAVKNYSLKAELVGKVWVNKVENGEAVDMRIEVKKFDVNGKGAWAAGDPLMVGREGGRVYVLTPEGKECPESEVLKAVEIMFDGLGVNPAHEDEIFATKGAHKAGVEWAIDAAGLAPEVARLTSARIDPAKFKAKAKVVGVEAGRIARLCE